MPGHNVLRCNFSLYQRLPLLTDSDRGGSSQGIKWSRSIVATGNRCLLSALRLAKGLPCDWRSAPLRSGFLPSDTRYQLTRRISNFFPPDFGNSGGKMWPLVLRSRLPSCSS